MSDDPEAPGPTGGDIEHGAQSKAVRKDFADNRARGGSTPRAEDQPRRSKSGSVIRRLDEKRLAALTEHQDRLSREHAEKIRAIREGSPEQRQVILDTHRAELAEIGERQWAAEGGGTVRATHAKPGEGGLDNIRLRPANRASRRVAPRHSKRRARRSHAVVIPFALFVLVVLVVVLKVRGA